jgi:BolA-like protein 1
MSETADGPVAMRIREKLLSAFAPVHLAVLNESFMHNVPKGAETHFKVVVVSSQFDGAPLLQRHRMVNAALADELAGGVHALSIVGKTPAQWEKSNGAVAASPNCLGGMKNDPSKQAFLESLADGQKKE